MAQKRFEGMLERNEKYVETYKPGPNLKTMLENMPAGYQGIYILTCADSRVVPYEIFGLARGEASIIRNAGGRASDAFRSLEVMGSIGPIGLIVVMHHTDCGGLFTTDDTVRETLSKRAPEHASTIKDKWFGTFRDIGLEESIRQDVGAIKAWPFLPEYTKVVGYAYEVESGRVREVVGAVAQVESKARGEADDCLNPCVDLIAIQHYSCTSIMSSLLPSNSPQSLPSRVIQSQACDIRGQATRSCLVDSKC